MKGAFRNFCIVLVLLVLVFAVPTSVGETHAQQIANVNFINNSNLNLRIGTNNYLIVTNANGQNTTLRPETAQGLALGQITSYRNGNEEYNLYTYQNGVVELRSYGVIKTDTSGYQPVQYFDPIYSSGGNLNLRGLSSSNSTYVITPVQNSNGTTDYYVNSERIVSCEGSNCRGEKGNMYGFTDAGVLSTINRSTLAAAAAAGLNLVKYVPGLAGLAAGIIEQRTGQQLGNTVIGGTTVKPDGDASKCETGITNILTGACMMRFLAIGGDLLLRGTSYILYFCGIFFDTAVSYTIVNMKANFESFSSVGQVWSLIRDIINICFIFIMLAISIGTILQLSSFNVKQTLSKLIIAALIMNFSLFYTKVLIDASNIVTLAFYSKMTVNDSQNGGSADGGLSAAFLNTLRINSIYSRTAGSQALNTVTNTNAAQPAQNAKTDVAYGLTSTKYWDIFLVSMFGSIALIIVAIAFFSATIMLLFRFFMLLILLATSLLPIAAMILPQTSSWSSKWWSKLWKELIALPVFMIIMYISFITMKSQAFKNLAQTDAGFANIGTTTNIGGPVMSTILSFTFTVALIFGAVIAAQSLGGYGAGVTRKIFGSAMSAIGRNTAGRASRLAGKGYDRIASSDTVKTLGKYKAFSLLGDVTGIRAATRSVREGFKKGEKYGYGGASLEQREKEDKEVKNKYDAKQSERHKVEALQAYINNREEIDKNLADPKNADLKAKFEQAALKIKPEELAELEVEFVEKMINDLPSETFEGLLKADALKDNPEALKKFKAARVAAGIKPFKDFTDNDERFTKLMDGREEITQDMLDAIGKITDENVHLLDPKFLDTNTERGKFFTQMFSKKAHDKIQESKNVGSYTKEQIKKQRSKGALSDFSQLQVSVKPYGDTQQRYTAMRDRISAMDTKSLKEFLTNSGVLSRNPASLTFTEQHVVASIAPSQLEAFEKEGNVDIGFAHSVGELIRHVGENPTGGFSETVKAYQYVKRNNNGTNRGYVNWS